MQRLMKWCARGAIGLGAAALLLAGVPAHAGPASCESVLAPADASRNSQPLRLAQSKTQPEEAEKLEQQRLKEQQEREKLEHEKDAARGEAGGAANEANEAHGEERPRSPGGGAGQTRRVALWRRGYPE